MASTAERVQGHFPAEGPRVVVVGAGIAGATLAACLRRRGLTCGVVEREPAGQGEGYMLGLLPLGGRVLDALGAGQAYRERSVQMRRYVLHDRRARVLRRYDLDVVTGGLGDWRGVERGALVDLLRARAGPVEYGARVTALEEATDGIRVEFDDGSATTADLVVAADGIGSSTRSLVLSDQEVEHHDTGWSGYVVWAGPAGQDEHTYREMWSAGWGVGAYPVPGRTGLFLAGRQDAMTGATVDDIAGRTLARLPEGPFSDLVAARENSGPGHLWTMSDIRSREWQVGRTLLLGDAAAAFLPTAGVGASAAMDSAQALAEELADTPNDPVGAGRRFVARQRERVEQLQTSSRTLARFMFVDSAPGAFLRDQVMRLYTLGMLTRSIRRTIEEPR